MEPVPTTTISLPTASVNKDLTKESTFKQRMVSKLKNIKSYLWAVLKTFVTLGIIKFKVSPHKVNSINLMGDNKYINFFSDDSIHIFVGNHLNRNNIGPSHRSNIPTNAENVLTKEIIRQEITTAIENAQDKPITFTLNTSDYKADTKAD